MFPHGGNDDDERSDNDSIDNGVIEKNVKAGETRDKRRSDMFDSFILKIISTVFNIPNRSIYIDTYIGEYVRTISYTVLVCHVMPLRFASGGGEGVSCLGITLVYVMLRCTN